MFQEKQKKVQLARLILKHLLKKNYTIEFSFTHTVRYIAASCVTVQNHPKLDPSTAAPYFSDDLFYEIKYD